ncbi:MAG: type II transport protein GspH [Ideonella sp.]|nr:type II transport protein GspH [Ideonella sp.]MCC7457800.1 GspH/FimT family pseudopilin [Nitrospira sp.]
MLKPTLHSAVHQRGFTIVELMVGIVLLAILLAMGGPSFAAWLQNSQIRNMSEGLKDGLQLARAEAVRRNALVRFELMTSLDGSCALSASGTNWIVSMDGAAGECNSTNMADAAAPVAPRVIQARPAGDGSRNATVSSTASSITFNGFGRMVSPAADVAIDVSNPDGGSCLKDSGQMRCLRVVVGVGGQVKMCDARSSFTGTSEGC